MLGEDFGKGLGCLAVFAVIGFIAAIILLIMAIVWLFNHIQII